MGFGCHRNLFLSSRVAAWQEQPGHSINHFCRSWWWCIPSALSVHAIVCTLQIPRLIHLLPPRPNTHAPSTLPGLLQEGGQHARPRCGEEGAPLPLPCSPVGSKPRVLVRLDKVSVKCCSWPGFCWRRHGPAFCWDLERDHCNCWEEFLVLKCCWCTSYNRPFMCETSEDTTFVLQFRY